MTENKRTKKRVLLMGLDAAGKTSILLSLQNDTRLSSYQNIPPTTDIARAVVTDEHNEFFIFDFGGQETFRNGYLKNLGDHLGDVDKVIFVIDIKDNKRFEIAVDYLTKIVNYLASNPRPSARPGSHPVPVSVFFHKYDLLPGGKEDASLDPATRELSEALARVMPEGYPYEIHKTSIYAQFQKTRIK
ncbi:MAG: 50S ribosome-binding GTPase [Candidatus Lokiarchaeota archaeon]|nr:50S ribosome-binding GTPase [Candidatus Lokiarchaeota archaeon]